MSKVIQLNDDAQTIIEVKNIKFLKAGSTIKLKSEEIWVPYVISFDFYAFDKMFELNYSFNLDSLEECKKAHVIACKDHETLKQILLKKYEA